MKKHVLIDTSELHFVTEFLQTSRSKLENSDKIECVHGYLKFSPCSCVHLLSIRLVQFSLLLGYSFVCFKCCVQHNI